MILIFLKTVNPIEMQIGHMKQELLQEQYPIAVLKVVLEGYHRYFLESKLYMPAYTIYMMAFIQMMAIWTPALYKNSDNTTRPASGSSFRWKSLASINL